MLFLLNDAVFDLDDTCPVTARDARRFEKLGLDYVLELGCELFSEDPLLHRNDPVRARRPEVNAAMFAAPAQNCAPELVEPRFCALPRAILRQLSQRDARGKLDAVAADRVVWNRMAA